MIKNPEERDPRAYLFAPQVYLWDESGDAGTFNIGSCVQQILSADYRSRGYSEEEIILHSLMGTGAAVMALHTVLRQIHDGKLTIGESIEGMPKLVERFTVLRDSLEVSGIIDEHRQIRGEIE